MHVKEKLLYIIIPFIVIIFILVIIYLRSYSKLNVLEDTLYDDLNNVNLYQETKNFIQEENWSLSIPSLNLFNIPIKDDVDEKTLQEYVGHFLVSSYYDGNVCLAAHNAGYKYNYFENINQLNTGDKIIYNYYGNMRTYTVSKSYIISDDEFSILYLDEDNKLTLVTCISGSPNLRLCVEAICKE